MLRTIPAMIDPHIHLREKPGVMASLIQLSYAAGVDVLGPMPNTDAGLTTARQVVDYINLAKALTLESKQMYFIPIGMVNEQTTRAQIDEFLDVGIRNVKVYPLDRTTKSHNGVRDYSKLLNIVRYGGERGMTFHFHPEHPDMDFENRDAEWAFLSNMDMFMRNTKAILVWEHGTDARCIPFWKKWGVTGRFFVSLCAHHLLTNESRSFGDVRAVCKPPIKTENDRTGLLSFIAEDYSWVYAGSDGAFHPTESKHVHKGNCACGAFTNPYTLLFYAHALDRLLRTKKGTEVFVNFTSRNARKFFKVPFPPRFLTLVDAPTEILSPWPVGGFMAETFWAGQSLNWSFDTNS